MTREEFESTVASLLGDLPEMFVRRISNLSIQVEEVPSSEILAEVGFEDPLDLLGYYSGTPLHERRHDSVELPDIILLYRQPILNEALASGMVVERVILETLLHELAHHFGFSEADMERVEREWAGRYGC